MNSKTLLGLFFLLSYISLSAQSDYCLRDTSFHIVVLGSSTAAGSGANPSDSAWVNRYRADLQSLNPDYRVTNLAQGGFTTYRLMPDSFVPPAGRPAIDTSRNITKALSLQPDALIINLPSNDVSSGFTVEEQLDNFEILIGEAENAGIPIWVSTTQPKNYNGNLTLIQKQLDVRDSLQSRYAPFVIDFWTGLADSTNQLADAYDSGDGTHLNNRGHQELFERVKATNISGFLYVPPSFPVIEIGQVWMPVIPLCGDNEATVQIEVYNRGTDSSTRVKIALLVTNTDSLQGLFYQDSTLSGIEGCTADTLTLTVNISAAGNYRLIAFFNDGGTPPPPQDQQILDVQILGTPQPMVFADTNCVGETQLLSAASSAGDWINWFSDSIGDRIFGPSPIFQTPPLFQTTTYYINASRGTPFYSNTLNTSFNTNVNWNGMMIDLVADTTLILDSIAFKLSDPGMQIVEVNHRMQAHFNYALSPQGWEFLRADTFDIAIPESPISIPLNINLEKGDTLALYFQLANPAARLTYQRVNNPILHQTEELQLTATSGISHNYTEVYSPRDFRGAISYHFGEKTFGDCQSERIPVTAFVSDPEVDLGRDSILDISQQITLDAGAGFASYLWSDGSEEQLLILDGQLLGLSVNEVFVEVTDPSGCQAQDTITISFEQLVNSIELRPEAWAIWPNPAKTSWQVRLPVGEWKLCWYDQLGRKQKEAEVNCGRDCRTQIPVGGLKTGLYYLEIRSLEGVFFIRKIMVH